MEMEVRRCEVEIWCCYIVFFFFGLRFDVFIISCEIGRGTILVIWKGRNSVWSKHFSRLD